MINSVPTCEVDMHWQDDHMICFRPTFQMWTGTSLPPCPTYRPPRDV